jgi:hypothetical protein
MASHFQTYGPFPMQRRHGVDIDALENFWAQDSLPGGLCDDSGIYIICTQHGSAPLKPWYVGQTHRRYESRFLQHLRQGKFYELEKKSPNGPLQIFLIARRTSTSKPTKSARRNSKAIREIEFALIGACLSVNKKLLNVSEANFFNGIYVPGFRGAKLGRPKSAATKLANMLRSQN